MYDWLQRAAARRPDRPAVSLGARELTYTALLSRATARAERLARDGLAAGDRMTLEIEDRFEFAVALHACLLAGAAAVPLDLRLSEAERAARRLTGLATRREGVATVMHTSGTTSAPKPVELTLANWHANALGSAVMLGLDLDERWLCAMPLAHVGGLSILLRSTIYATTVVLHERFEVGAVLEELMDPDRRITLVSLVPTMLARLLDAGLRCPPRLRWVLLGGGPIPAPLLARAAEAGVPVAPTYGMTEACSQICTFGLPLPGVSVRLGPAGEGEGEATLEGTGEDGAPGEILVRGPVLAPGVAAGDGWLHTGDLGRWHATGRLEVVGRSSDTIVSGGENVAPAEVEGALLEHPAVADAGVFARTDPEWGEAIVARVVLRDGRSATERELQDFCRRRLARFKVPKAIEFADGLPRTVSGKLLRRDLG